MPGIQVVPGDLPGHGQALADVSAAVRGVPPARYRLMFAASGYAPDAVATFTLVQDAITTCVNAGVSASEDPRTDTWLLWAALHGLATLEKPARSGYLRLGPLDRPAMLETLIRRIARLR